jgi:hypothetical protein
MPGHRRLPQAAARAGRGVRERVAPDRGQLSRATRPEEPGRGGRATGRFLRVLAALAYACATAALASNRTSERACGAAIRGGARTVFRCRFLAALSPLVSDAPRRERSFKQIRESDLRRLAHLAAADRADFFDRYPEYDVYRDAPRCIVLAQGAALFYVTGERGIHDFDVWTFWIEEGGVTFPPRRRAKADFGPSRFGRSRLDDEERFMGRRVDLLGRTIPGGRGSVLEAVIRYVRAGKSETARELGLRPLVLIEPPSRRGDVIWKP